jgi:hypothetical protein
MMKPEDLYKQHRMRSDPITCLLFGPNRKVDFPGYFFCHGCDLLEDAVLNGSKRASLRQKRYMCTGGHVNLLHPATVIAGYCPRKSLSPSFPAYDGQEKNESKSPSKSPVKKKI